MAIAPEAAEQIIEQIYRSMHGNQKSSFRLWGIDISFSGIAGLPVLGCCMEHVIGFCLENRPKNGDVVQCSERCGSFRGKLIFDSKNKTWKKHEWSEATIRPAKPPPRGGRRESAPSP